jgi:hypothetical protein
VRRLLRWGISRPNVIKRRIWIWRKVKVLARGF